MASERDNWLVSTYTGGQGNCVEVSPGLPVLVRDTKDRDGIALPLTPAAWRRLLKDIKSRA
jgi:hypothetical protein